MPSRSLRDARSCSPEKHGSVKDRRRLEAPIRRGSMQKASVCNSAVGCVKANDQIAKSKCSLKSRSCYDRRKVDQNWPHLVQRACFRPQRTSDFPARSDPTANDNELLLSRLCERPVLTDDSRSQVN